MTPLSTAGLSWCIHDAANIISTNAAKKNFSGTDRGEMLIFRQFIHSWLCYELVKVLYVFGLQPQIRSDTSDWSQELHTTFDYFTNKQHEHKEMALKVLVARFDKTKHNSYFSKLILGSKQKFKHIKNPTLCLVMLTWLQQLQPCFFEKSEQDPLRDWNKYGRYYGTGTGFISGRSTLSNINMSTVKGETHSPVTDVSYFKPNKERDDAVTSLEEWAVRLFEPEITDILKVAKKIVIQREGLSVQKNQLTSSSLTQTTQL